MSVGWLLDTFVDQVFDFVDEPLLESQVLRISYSSFFHGFDLNMNRNFGPVEEIGEPVNVSIVEGRIPDDFPEGVYIRNGSNPLFGGFKSAVSVFGKTSSVWIEGEGMLHAVYFEKGNAVYSNKYAETETFKLEKARNRPCFLPAVEAEI
ncbi:hypothetical protein C2S52_008762 [Perilla frutescens var. hirtella]|nr:hypothetical protein C2S52_008762 [Perilla frutescens var. hirtella]